MTNCCELPAACKAVLEEHLDAELFRALCDPRRLVLLAELCLSGEPKTVSESAACCGVHLSGVSRHLAILKRAGVVHATKSGREVRYQLDYGRLTGVLRGLADAIDQCRQVATDQPSGETA